MGEVQDAHEIVFAQEPAGACSASTLRRALAPPDAAPPVILATASRVIEIWRPLLQRWTSLIATLAESDGPYVVCEGHWDEGYLDPDLFVYEMEGVATEMLPWTEAAYMAAPDGALDATGDDIQDALGELSEGVRGEDSFTLGPAATRCIATWAWGPAPSAAQWRERLTWCGRAKLDPPAMASVAATLPTDARQALFDLLICDN